MCLISLLVLDRIIKLAAFIPKIRKQLTELQPLLWLIRQLVPVIIYVQESCYCLIKMHTVFIACVYNINNILWQLLFYFMLHRINNRCERQQNTQKQRHEMHVSLKHN